MSPGDQAGTGGGHLISSSMRRDAACLLCDIRGFSSWMAKNQREAPGLLGDGFLVVHEEDRNEPDGLKKSRART